MALLIIHASKESIAKLYGRVTVKEIFSSTIVDDAAKQKFPGKEQIVRKSQFLQQYHCKVQNKQQSNGKGSTLSVFLIGIQASIIYFNDYWEAKKKRTEKKWCT